MRFIGKYEVIAELGEGGMGTATLGRSPEGRLVVLKRPLPGMPELRELLLDEARVGLRLRHEHLVETLDFFELEGDPVLVVAYVSGTSLAALRQHAPVPLGAVCRIGRQIAEALDALHHATDDTGRALEVVHRDVTPGNIVVGHDGNARLIDLGIAKHVERTAQKTRTGFLRGTLRYLAPEVFNRGHYSAQSDLWSLGVCLLDAALGRLAIEGSEGEIVAKVVYGRVIEFLPGESLEPRFLRAVQKLLARDPGDRPRRGRDAAALFAMLEKELGSDEGAVAASVRAAIGEEKPFDDESSKAATEVLTGRASAIFCPPTEMEATESMRSSESASEAHAELLDTLPPLSPLDSSGALEVEQLAKQVSELGLDPDQVRREIDGELRRYLGMVRQHEVDSGAVSPSPSPSADAQRSAEIATAAAQAVSDRPPSGPIAMSATRGLDGPRIAGIVAGAVLALFVVFVVVQAIRGGSAMPSNPTPAPVAAADPLEPAAALDDDDVPDDELEPPTEEPPAAAAPTRAGRRSKARRGRRKPIVHRDVTLDELRKKMPPCWSPGRTRLFYYPDKNGTMVAARRFSEVPKSKRNKVRCAD